MECLIIDNKMIINRDKCCCEKMFDSLTMGEIECKLVSGVTKLYGGDGIVEKCPHCGRLVDRRVE